MSNLLVSVSNADYRLPEPVLQALMPDVEDTVALSVPRFPAEKYGVRGDNNPASAAANSAALAAAFTDASLSRGIVELPAGVIHVEGHFSLAGYQCGFVGQGVNNRATGTPAMRGTVIKAVNQDGAVLDFEDFLWPVNMLGSVEIGNFAVQGDGTSDATTANGVGGATKQGIRIARETGDVVPTGINMHDIVISQTGGVGMSIKDVYLSEFRNIVVTDPVSCKANDVPYMLHMGANGNRYYGLGLRSLRPDSDCGVSGALRLIPSDLYQHHNSVYYGTWAENLHVPTGGTIVATRTNAVVWSDTEFFDVYKEVGATGTSRFRLEADPLAVSGGNLIRGVIPGKGTDTESIDTGVQVQQNGNLIQGVKGYRGTNVTIDAGVTGTTVNLGGAFADASDAAVVDNSGNTSNTAIDEYMGRHVYGARSGTTAIIRANGVDLPLIRSSQTIAAAGNPNMAGGTNSFRITLAGAVTLGAPSSRQDKLLYLALIQDATGSRTVTWNITYKFPGGVSPVLSTAPGKVDRFTFEWSGSAWECIAVQLGL